MIIHCFAWLCRTVAMKEDVGILLLLGASFVISAGKIYNLLIYSLS